ncbi:hypothetical protein ACIRRA_22980 [Nocardia sp. NPDC101769]|uniref:hypothetical protein n=1 Tax=Nocardia sp. NPDC101769 TaxID=3364333 RepID=UPI0037F4E387
MVLSGYINLYLVNPAYQEWVDTPEDFEPYWVGRGSNRSHDSPEDQRPEIISDRGRWTMRSSFEYGERHREHIRYCRIPR